MATETPQVIQGEGYTVATLDDLGGGPGFRKIRKALGVTAFGVNAVVLPGNYATGKHYHDQQEELYFVHRGRIRFEFGDGTSHEVGEGGLVRVAAQTVRRLRNIGDGEAIYLCAGGKDGYVGRDGQSVPDEE